MMSETLSGSAMAMPELPPARSMMDAMPSTPRVQIPPRIHHARTPSAPPDMAAVSAAVTSTRTPPPKPVASVVTIRLRASSLAGLVVSAVDNEVIAVAPGSEPANSGIRIGDVVVRVGGLPLRGTLEAALGDAEEEILEVERRPMLASAPSTIEAALPPAPPVAEGAPAASKRHMRRASAPADFGNLVRAMLPGRANGPTAAAPPASPAPDAKASPRSVLRRDSDGGGGGTIKSLKAWWEARKQQAGAAAGGGEKAKPVAAVLPTMPFLEDAFAAAADDSEREL